MSPSIISNCPTLGRLSGLSPFFPFLPLASRNATTVVSVGKKKFHIQSWLDSDSDGIDQGPETSSQLSLTRLAGQGFADFRDLIDSAVSDQKGRTLRSPWQRVSNQRIQYPYGDISSLKA